MTVVASSLPAGFEPFSPAWLLPSPQEEGGQLGKHGCGSQACSGAGFEAPVRSAAARWGRRRWGQSAGQKTYWGRLAEQAGQVLSLLPSVTVTLVTLPGEPGD